MSPMNDKDRFIPTEDFIHLAINQGWTIREQTSSYVELVSENKATIIKSYITKDGLIDFRRIYP